MSGAAGDESARLPHAGTVDCVVIGAGVIGLAIARRAAQRGLQVMVLEAADRPGTQGSARNSGVLHAGLYYAPGTLRARLCAPGRAALEAFCEAHRVPFRRCGKLVVACESTEVPALEALAARAEANGVPVRWLSGAEARLREPAVRCVAALESPTSGIVDPHALVQALARTAAAAGATLALRSPVRSGTLRSTGARLQVGGTTPCSLTAHRVVNAAGLGAWEVARQLTDDGGAPAEPVPERYLAKGTWFALQGPRPFRGLVYPLPGPASLGIHACLDLAGNVRFGPDIEWVDRVDYRPDDNRTPPVYADVRRWFPALPDDALVANDCGIRTKIQAHGDPPADWWIRGPAHHGHPGLVHLLGMESPGLTGALAIADHVVAMLLGPSPDPSSGEWP